jgi:hypothetical protein
MLATKRTKKVSGFKLEEKKEEKKKSKTTLFWEKYPNGILKIVDMRAVLK